MRLPRSSLCQLTSPVVYKHFELGIAVCPIIRQLLESNPGTFCEHIYLNNNFRYYMYILYLHFKVTPLLAVVIWTWWKWDPLYTSAGHRDCEFIVYISEEIVLNTVYGVHQLANKTVSSLCTFQERLCLVSLYFKWPTWQWVHCVHFRRDCT